MMKTLELTSPLPMATSGTQVASRVAQLPVAPGLLTAKPDSLRFTPVVTLVLWLGCAVIGGLGLTLSYARPQAVVTPEALTVEMLHVELTGQPHPELQTLAPQPEAQTIPPPAEAVFQPNLPPPLAVATPSPAIAFAVPVEGTTRVVELTQAGHATSARHSATEVAPLTPQPLTFGQGAGRQPAPDYPLRAQREKQEGVVTVRFTVGENGRVAAAEAVQPSAWPLLNESAVRAIRNRWRFAPGAPRAYEVAIRFVLPETSR